MTDTLAIERVGIVGAGFMGSGIAESVAKAGIDVVLHEPEPAVLERSRTRLDESLTRAVRGGKLQDTAMEQALAHVSWSVELDALAACELVIEAVYEDPAVKGPLFRSLDAMLAQSVILASNTSSIPIAQLASWTRCPERVLGMHFFSPVPVMRLVEVVVGIDTAPDCVARAGSRTRSARRRFVRRTARASS
jgi:3-hydroxybutyryl-CoA dehydrogenase